MSFSTQSISEDVNFDSFSFFCKCLGGILDGLREGLSHFSGPSRVAIIYKLRRDLPFFIIDQQNLLRGHEVKLKEL
jgi:hypothetical protein